MTNSVDPDETPRSAASHLGLNCLIRPVCPNIIYMVNTVTPDSLCSNTLELVSKGKYMQLVAVLISSLLTSRLLLKHTVSFLDSLVHVLLLRHVEL